MEARRGHQIPASGVTGSGELPSVHVDTDLKSSGEQPVPSPGSSVLETQSGSGLAPRCGDPLSSSAFCWDDRDGTQSQPALALPGCVKKAVRLSFQF